MLKRLAHITLTLIILEMGLFMIMGLSYIIPELLSMSY